MQVKQQIRGLYLGNIPFRGVITEMRPLTVRTDGCFVYFVALSEPVTVFGEQRDSLVVNAKFDGSPSSYTRYTDSISAA